MTKKKVSHLPRYMRSDLAKASKLNKRQWRIDDGKYECGKDITANTGNAITRRFTTCAACMRVYDAWWASVFESNDPHRMVQHIHLVNTNMDPARFPVPF